MKTTCFWLLVMYLTIALSAGNEHYCGSDHKASAVLMSRDRVKDSESFDWLFKITVERGELNIGVNKEGEELLAPSPQSVVIQEKVDGEWVSIGIIPGAFLPPKENLHLDEGGSAKSIVRVHIKQFQANSRYRLVVKGSLGFVDKRKSTTEDRILKVNVQTNQ